MIIVPSINSKQELDSHQKPLPTTSQSIPATALASVSDSQTYPSHQIHISSHLSCLTCNTASYQLASISSLHPPTTRISLRSFSNSVSQREHCSAGLWYSGERARKRRLFLDMRGRAPRWLSRLLRYHLIVCCANFLFVFGVPGDMHGKWATAAVVSPFWLRLFGW
jgi:hypothetical protein